jgi:hypothetical protein
VAIRRLEYTYRTYIHTFFGKYSELKLDTNLPVKDTINPDRILSNAMPSMCLLVADGRYTLLEYHLAVYICVYVCMGVIDLVLSCSLAKTQALDISLSSLVSKGHQFLPLIPTPHVRCRVVRDHIHRVKRHQTVLFIKYIRIGLEVGRRRQHRSAFPRERRGESPTKGRRRY